MWSSATSSLEELRPQVFWVQVMGRLAEDKSPQVLDKEAPASSKVARRRTAYMVMEELRMVRRREGHRAIRQGQHSREHTLKPENGACSACSRPTTKYRSRSDLT